MAVGSPSWIAWLTDPATRSFSFKSASATYTARKESRARGGESYFQSRCREMGLDPNEICTSRTAEISEWVWGDSQGLDDPPRLVAVS